MGDTAHAAASVPATTEHRTSPATSASGLFLVTAAVALFGFAYGADSYAAGDGILRPVLASALIQGGASQIAAASVLRMGGPAIAAILVGLALNLRFMALGLVIAPDLPSGRLRRLLSAHLVSDLPVGMAITERPASRARTFFLLGFALWGAWVGGTLLGAIAGRTFNVSVLGADGAITASFVALAVEQIAGWRTAVVAVVAFAVTAALLAWAAGAAVPGGALAGLVTERVLRARPGGTA
jgi:predicted branched-subunit amino acid permease